MSSNSSITTAPSISALPQILSQYLSLTLGFIILISGTVGNCLNILVFLTVGHYKSNACSLYMLAGSLFDLLFLHLGLNTRIFGQGFNMDFTLINKVWCKLRSSLLDIISLCSFTCLSLQSVDVFFLTSRSVAMRQRSNIKIARILLITFMFLWTVQEIPYIIFQDLVFINGTPSCVRSNAFLASYHTYIITLVFTVGVPITVISFFALHIHQQMASQTVRERHSLSGVARQMGRMALYQIAIVLLFQFPFGVETVYFVCTTNVEKSLNRQLEDNLTQAFFNVYVYGLYASSFYCYYAASKRFRCQVVDTIKRLILKRRNQILPISRTFPVQQQTTHP